MTEQPVKRGDVWWISLDPAQGSEIKKTRPCVVLTHDTLNRLRARAKNNFTFWTQMHPARLRCENSKYREYSCVFAPCL